MSLKEQLLEELKNAMKEKDSVKKNTVQMARAAILQVEKDNRITLDDDGIIDVIAKEVKKRRDVLPDYEKSGRQDLIDSLKAEVDVLLQYLPQQLSEEELEAIVRKAVQDTGAASAKDMGRIMQAVMPQVKGRADGKMINAMVKKIIG
jgi:uncharacterized protein YqeY